MKHSKLLLALLGLSVGAVASVRAQLMDLSFDADVRFRNDFVNTEFYFWLPEDSTAHFDFRFNPQPLSAGDDFVRIRVTDPVGEVIFNEQRALDHVAVSGEEYKWYTFNFTEQKSDGPNDRRFYESLSLDLLVGPSWVNENGVVIPPDVEIDFLSELYVYGWSPMIQYVPPGHGGTFRFSENATNVSLEFVPVPEPSTYGLTALALLVGVVGCKRWRRGARTAAAMAG